MQLWSRAFAVCTFILSLMAAASALAQTPESSWSVFMQTQPCAESLRQWMSVAERDPSQAPSQYELAWAQGGSGAVRFPRTAAGFVAAHAMADALRIAGFGPGGATTQTARYENYCCKNYSVFERRESNGEITRVAARDFSSPGRGFVATQSGMCCEHAATLADGRGACGLFRLANGTVIQFRRNGPAALTPAPVTIGSLTIPAAGSIPGRICNFEGFSFRSGQSYTRHGVVTSGHACNRSYGDGRSGRGTPVAKVTVLINPSNGTATPGNRSVSYRSNPGYSGNDRFQVRVTFESGRSADIAYFITVLPGEQRR